MSVQWEEIGWSNTDTVKVRNLWEQKDEGEFVGSFEA